VMCSRSANATMQQSTMSSFVPGYWRITSLAWRGTRILVDLLVGVYQCDVTEKPSIRQRSRRMTSFHACKPNEVARNEIPRGRELLLVTTHRLLTQLSKQVVSSIIPLWRVIMSYLTQMSWLRP
jgi:hypothetical protein